MKNINSMSKACNTSMDILSKHYVEQNLTYSMIPLDINRKIPHLCELLDVRSNLISLDNFDFLRIK